MAVCESGRGTSLAGGGGISVGCVGGAPVGGGGGFGSYCVWRVSVAALAVAVLVSTLVVVVCCGCCVCVWWEDCCECCGWLVLDDCDVECVGWSKWYQAWWPTSAGAMPIGARGRERCLRGLSWWLE